MPDLPYDYGALEPVISGKIMEVQQFYDIIDDSCITRNITKLMSRTLYDPVPSLTFRTPRWRNTNPRLKVTMSHHRLHYNQPSVSMVEATSITPYCPLLHALTRVILGKSDPAKILRGTLWGTQSGYFLEIRLIG